MRRIDKGMSELLSSILGSLAYPAVTGEPAVVPKKVCKPHERFWKSQEANGWDIEFRTTTRTYERDKTVVIITEGTLRVESTEYVRMFLHDDRALIRKELEEIAYDDLVNPQEFDPSPTMMPKNKRVMYPK